MNFMKFKNYTDGQIKLVNMDEVEYIYQVNQGKDEKKERLAVWFKSGEVLYFEEELNNTYKRLIIKESRKWTST